MTPSGRGRPLVQAQVDMVFALALLQQAHRHWDAFDNPHGDRAVAVLAPDLQRAMGGLADADLLGARALEALFARAARKNVFRGNQRRSEPAPVNEPRRFFLTDIVKNESTPLLLRRRRRGEDILNARFHHRR